MASAAAGDDVAFGRIVAAHHADLVRVCVVVARDTAIAEDAVQAAWSIAWRRLATLQDPLRLRPWLMAVAVNETEKLLRQRGRRRILESPWDLPEGPGDLPPAPEIAADG